jgi:hypothetical protein
MPHKMLELIAGFHLPPLALFEGGEPVRNSTEWKERRKEILGLLQREMYGTTPPPCPVAGSVLKEDDMAYSGKAVERFLEIHLAALGGNISFPATLVIPKKRPVRGIFVNIAFMVAGVDGFRYCPVCPIEEIIDEGFAIALYDYLDVAGDDDDFTKGLAGVFPREEDTGWGKLGIWAYSMSRVADYLRTLDVFKAVPFAAAGFSRLGKAALWCGAQDEGFDFVIPFGSGTGGAGFTRRNRKETMEELLRRNWFWFCGNFRHYTDAGALPFDQHFVIAACAPRKFLTLIAEDDVWADVENEYLSCIAASEGYRLSGARGFIAPDSIPRADVFFPEGDIAMGLRRGTHFLSRADWRLAMDYIRRTAPGRTAEPGHPNLPEKPKAG